MVKCSNLQNVTSQEISQRFEYLKTNGYPNLNPQLLMQSCRLFGEKTSARLNRLRLNIRAIVQELKSELLNINVAYETLSDLTKLFKTPYFQGLPEAQQNYFYQIYQDLDRYQHRYGRQLRIDPAYTPSRI